MEPLTLILLAIAVMAVVLYLIGEAVKTGAKVQERSESFSQLPPAEKLKKRARMELGFTIVAYLLVFPFPLYVMLSGNYKSGPCTIGGVS